MKRVLILYKYNSLGMSDFEKTDYRLLSDRVKRECSGKFPNFGNKVWLQGITSAVTTPYIEYTFGYEDLSPDYVNENFDCVLMPLANCFNKNWVRWLNTRGDYVSKLKIPVHIIACGAQADSYDDLNRLVEDTAKDASYMINAVYNTGGNIALRGYFTAEYFEKLGFHDYTVTGCPSIYQMGRGLKISNEKVGRDEFKATINGDFKLPLDEKSFRRAEFICQGNYGKMLYDSSYFDEVPYDFSRIKKLISRGEKEYLYALAEGRIHLFSDIQDWMSYFTSEKISFSFGSRIHGTIMPILSGVPSLILARDSRTREMAEFYDIPAMLPEENSKKSDIYDLYLSTDYSQFNKKFAERFDAYEAFLRKCGLVENVNQTNIFMNREAPHETPFIVNQDRIDELKRYLEKNSFKLSLLEKYYSFKK